MKHHHRGQSGYQDRTPDLLRSAIGRLFDRYTLFAKTVDVLKNDDGRVDHHAYREGDSGQ